MKYFIRFLVFAVLTVLVLFTYKGITQQKEVLIKIPENISFGDVPLQAINDTFSHSHSINYKTVVVTYFDTQCDFCQHEIRDIIEHIHLFEEIKIALVSAQPLDTLLRFSDTLNIENYTNIGVFKTDYLQLSKQLGDVIPPSTYVFDSSGTMVKKYKGQVRAPVLASAIQLLNSKKEQNE